MAPSAVSVESPSPTSKPETARTFGNYKEQAAGAKAYNKKLEEEGDAHHAKANVRLQKEHRLIILQLIPQSSI